MNLTQKEVDLLKDLKSQEQLCIDKYSKYETQACDTALKGIFSSIKSTEQAHLQTIQKIMNGETVPANQAPTAVSQKLNIAPSTCDAESKKHDAYLCRDALAMEKHVSTMYDMSVFEFANPSLRDTLGHIQKEEQNHGQQFYEYLSINNMYNA